MAPSGDNVGIPRTGPGPCCRKRLLFRRIQTQSPASLEGGPTARQSRLTENAARRNRVTSKLSNHTKRQRTPRVARLDLGAASAAGRGADGAGGLKLGQPSLPTKTTANRRANPYESGPRSGALARAARAHINPHRGALVSGPVRSMVRAPQPRIALEAALFQPLPAARASELREALPP